MQMPPKTININPNGMIANADARVGIKKSTNDTVTWNANGQGGPWTIVFLTSSPFGTSTFTVPQGGTKDSGQITVNFPGTPVKFRYEVRDASKNVVDDPDVILEG
jgi:hypothetical protein